MEDKIILDYVNKCFERYNKISGNYPDINVKLDLFYVRDNKGNILDFERLLSFGDFDFCHDIQGISSHINRKTHLLENLFEPRCGFNKKFDILSCKIICKNENNEEQIFKMTLESIKGDDKECFEGFMECFKRELPLHTMHPCYNCRLLKE